MNKYKDAVPAVAVTVAAASCITEAKNIGLSGNGSSQGSSWLCNGSSSSCCTAIEISYSYCIRTGSQTCCCSSGLNRNSVP